MAVLVQCPMCRRIHEVQQAPSRLGPSPTASCPECKAECPGAWFRPIPWGHDPERTGRLATAWNDLLRRGGAPDMRDFVLLF